MTLAQYLTLKKSRIAAVVTVIIPLSLLASHALRHTMCGASHPYHLRSIGPGTPALIFTIAGQLPANRNQHQCSAVSDRASFKRPRVEADKRPCTYGLSRTKRFAAHQSPRQRC